MERVDATQASPQFEYYLALIADTTKLSDRRQTTNDLFVGLNVVFFTGMGALFFASHLKTWWLAGLYAAITILTFFLNVTWVRLITRYRRLIGLRIRYMEQIEESLATEGIFIAFPPPVAKQRKSKNVTQMENDGEQAEATTVNITAKKVGIYTAEREHLYYKGSHFGFSRLETGLIMIFIFAYLLATLGTLAVTWLITSNVLHGVSL